MERLCEIAKSPVDQIILREKDLPKEEYAKLAAAVLETCPEMPKKLCLHQYPAVAADLRLPVQLPMRVFLEWTAGGRLEAPCGVSVHTPEEAVFAAGHGARWLIAGHIFKTACKPGLPARGLSFLREICEKVDIPTLAVGGITKARVPLVQEAGAEGVCVMSAWAKCENPGWTIATFVGE